MDNIDKKILSILQKDGRISVQKLAKKLPMSVPAAYERIRKLEDSGVITGYTACIDYTKLGKTVNAFILCSLRIGELESNIRWARRKPEIIAAYALAGRYSLLLQVSCTDMQEYHALVKELYTCSVIESHIVINDVKNVLSELHDVQPE